MNEMCQDGLNYGLLDIDPKNPKVRVGTWILFSFKLGDEDSFMLEKEASCQSGDTLSSLLHHEAQRNGVLERIQSRDRNYTNYFNREFNENSC